MAVVYLILALLIAVVAVIFAWLNPVVVSITFFAWKIDSAPLSLVIIATLLIGIIVGWLFAAPSLVKNSFRASGNRKRIGALEKELEDHRTRLSELLKPAPAAPPSPVPPANNSDTDPLGHS
ncbi:MAG: LapA family protein [Anaerolineales bacterium]|nr:LapA family protein [Anaerolineales bacterium]